MTQVPPPTVPPTTPPPAGGGAYTPPPPPPPSAGGSSDRTLMVVLSYLWILALIPLLTKKDDREIQWHAKNGLAILIAEVAIWILFTILSFAIGDVMGCGLTAVSCVVWIGFLVVRILCIVKGVNGQRFRVPMISDFADKM
ncbi:MAG TPA: DUF4870 domain-containing protein [Thermoanaerobaculia bacterium]|nr:DUF4870 domain-containing protein [Thermoanaerobaculia bacterium]